LVERHSSYVLLAKVSCRGASQPVFTAPDQTGASPPRELVKSRTWDRGKEMARHKQFTLATDAAVTFATR
jgi:IS30 family transposase